MTRGLGKNFWLNMDRSIGVSKCRGCLASELHEVINFGELPLANELTLTPKTVNTYPLVFSVCQRCSLGQVGSIVDPGLIFSDYRYTSSTSTTFLSHARNFVDDLIKNKVIFPGDFILEIASNDGYLLRNLPKGEFRILGVEPAENIAKLAQLSDIETLTEFFDRDLARRILIEYGHPRLIIANNVLAHVPDLQTFVEGISILCNQNTLVSIENPSILALLENSLFDTIYHEHFSYLGARAVKSLTSKYNLEIFDIESLMIHGGTNRYWISQKGVQSIKDSVENCLKIEGEKLVLERWKSFATQVQNSIEMFQIWLDKMESTGRLTFGYGAAAKASTFLNMVGQTSSKILGIFDNSPEKYDRFMPNQAIPILSPANISKLQIDNLIVFPWNITSELVSDFKGKNNSVTKFWKAVPSITDLGV